MAIVHSLYPSKDIGFEEEQMIISKLRDDSNYFGEFGRQFLSNSDLHNLMKNPDKFGQPWETNVDYLKGQYIHFRLLQPWFKDPMIVVDASTRGTTVYKEVVAEHAIEGQPKPMFLLQKEVDELDVLIASVEKNTYFMELLRGERDPSNHDVEEPAVGLINGYWFKGKADKLNLVKQRVVDLKTTRNLDMFVEFFKKYGYHSQAYIYRQLFGMDVVFCVVEKDTGRLGIFEVSEETYEEGGLYVNKGLLTYDMYFGDDAVQSLDQHYTFDII